MANAGALFIRYPGGGILSILILALCCGVAAAESTRRDDGRRYDVEALRYYKTLYSSEIFEYCLNQHGNSPVLPGCLERQQELKQRLFDRAQAQLGQRSPVQSIYDDCLDFYPDQGVARIRHCVDTRLLLRDKLNDAAAEREIYRRCDKKWRRHGAAPINTCSTHAANYYRDKGRFRD